MNLQEFTGKTPFSETPKTPQETHQYIKKLSENNYRTIWEFVDDIAILLAHIGEECLDSTNIVGEVGYDGSPLKPQWEIKEGEYPFHIKDHITGKHVCDPRVMLIGQIIHRIGSQQGHGLEFMQELYRATGKVFHSYISPLNYAWSGIGGWQA